MQYLLCLCVVIPMFTRRLQLWVSIKERHDLSHNETCTSWCFCLRNLWQNFQAFGVCSHNIACRINQQSRWIDAYYFDYFCCKMWKNRQTLIKHTSDGTSIVLFVNAKYSFVVSASDVRISQITCPTNLHWLHMSW